MMTPDLLKACYDAGHDIVLTHNGEAVYGPRLLATISGLESDFGRLREFVRYEKGYAPGGHYFNLSPEVRAQYRRWGCLACSSFGSFQIMFITAKELGYDGPPIDLQIDRVGAYWAAQLIVKRFIKRQGAKTLRDVLDAYNSGNHKDSNIPRDYVKKGFDFYDELKSI